MIVDILVDFRHGGMQYTAGSTALHVEDSLGEYFCGEGWAKDVSGGVPTGQHAAQDIVLDVQDTFTGHGTIFNKA
jgi:hypothetical protein